MYRPSKPHFSLSYSAMPLLVLLRPKMRPPKMHPYV